MNLYLGDWTADCRVVWTRYVEDVYLDSGVWLDGPRTGQPCTDDELDALAVANADTLCAGHAEERVCAAEALADAWRDGTY